MMERSVLPATDDNSGLTRHSTKMAQNGSRVIGKDSEVPSMPTAKEREYGSIIFINSNASSRHAFNSSLK